jgi:RhtB (resistance to homoserine/threonine) family protein
MSPYWPEFLKIASAHLLAVASPGPDFAIVIRQSLAHGRRAAIWTALGIGSAISLHITYSLFGIGLIQTGSAQLFLVVKFVGAGYLAWLGIQGLRTQPRPAGDPAASAAPPGPPQPARRAWRLGFFTNALNPKATLFFVAFFASLVSPRTPWQIRLGYGAWIIATTAGWFILVAFIFTHAPIRRAFQAKGHWIDRALGAVFLAFAVTLAVASLPAHGH